MEAEMSNNLPVVAQATDFNKALDGILEQNQTDLIYVPKEDLHPNHLFMPVFSVLKPAQDDYHNIKGKFMPKREYVDRIAEAAGAYFIAEHCGVRKEGEHCYVGFAQAKRRQADGTWRPSSVCEYEFDVDVRTEDDVKANPGKYKTEADKRHLWLTHKKFARRRANTGARLAVIREIVGMPTAFKQNQLGHSMIFSRVMVNTDQLLSEPDMRQAAIDHALGAADAIFGPKERNVTPEPKMLPEATPEGPKEEPGKDDIFNTQDEEKDPREEIRGKLQEWLDADDTGNVNLSESTRAVIEEAANSSDMTVEDLRKKLDTVNAYYKEKEEKAKAAQEEKAKAAVGGVA